MKSLFALIFSFSPCCNGVSENGADIFAQGLLGKS